MSVSGEQLNHAIKNAWPVEEHVKSVEERYLMLIQGLIELSGGCITIPPGAFTVTVNFSVEQDNSGNITLRSGA